MHRIQEELQIDSPDKFKMWVTYFYWSDPVTNTIINRRLLSVVLTQRKGLKYLPPEIPTTNELAWLAAEQYCDECPGSSYYEVGYGEVALQCHSKGRIQRFESCLKFRENIAAFKEMDENEYAARLREVKQEFEE